MHVILAGAGVGGLTAALSLAAQSVDVTLVEQSPAFHEVGAGLQLSPNATRLLFRLGLEGPLREIACRPEGAEVRSAASGRLLLRTELGAAAEQRWGAPYLQVHRADLQAVLANAVRACGRVNLMLGVRLEGLAQNRAGVTALAGAHEIGGDALIGCDGIRSPVRAALWGEQPARFTGQIAWRSLIRAERLSGVTDWTPSLTLVWSGSGRHFVHYPVRGGALVNLVGVVARQEWSEESWSSSGEPKGLEQDFRGWPEPVASLIAAADAVWRYAIHDRPPLARWSLDRASLLGDAAHPAPPFLAQGAGMAVEDAEALARHLAPGPPVPQALLAYEQERRSRTARAQAWARRNGALFHLTPLAARSIFAMADILDRMTGESRTGRRLDWLYGYDPGGQSCE